MAISTIYTTLKWGESAEAATKKVEIKDFPDLVGTPNMLETTHLGCEQQTFISGVRSADTMSFTCNFTSADYQTCTADAGKPLFYVLEFSDGSTFTWQGQHTCGIAGKGVDEVVEFTIDIAPSSAVSFSAAAG